MKDGEENKSETSDNKNNKIEDNKKAQEEIYSEKSKGN